MAVRQVSKKDGTKDGRRWYFYTYIRDITGNKKRYKSKKYHTQKEAERAERDFLTKVDKREINITDMTFKDLYEEFYEYKSDKVKNTTLRTYQVNSIPLKMFDNLKIRDFTVSHYLKWRTEISKMDLALKLKMTIISFLRIY